MLRCSGQGLGAVTVTSNLALIASDHKHPVRRIRGYIPSLGRYALLCMQNDTRWRLHFYRHMRTVNN